MKSLIPDDILTATTVIISIGLFVSFFIAMIGGSSDVVIACGLRYAIFFTILLITLIPETRDD